MSDSFFALVVVFSLLVAMIVWVPCLHLCRRCYRWVFQHTLPKLGMGLLLAALHGFAYGQFAVLNSITTVAGNGTVGSSGDGGQATSAAVNSPFGVVFDHAGNLYFSDSLEHVVRKVSPYGVITTIAGNGTAGYSGDGGPATSAMLGSPEGLVLDATGNLFIADVGNARIRKVAPSGTITTFAGTGAGGNTGNGGQATAAQIDPLQLAIDATGNLYVACDMNNNYTVRKISPSGVITAFAGTGTASYSGDGGLATAASFTTIEGIASDAAGNVYISSAADHRVREVTVADGKISTVAGNGTAGSSGDGGLATSAQLSPFGMVVDASGNLYLFDVGAYSIREVFAATKKITTLAGTGTRGFSGDGYLATQAQLGGLFDLALDASGNLYMADSTNSRIRAVGPLFIPATTVTSSAAPQKYLLQTTSDETISSFFAPPSLGNKQEYVIGTVTGCVVDGKTFNAAGAICSVPVTFAPAYPGQRPVPLAAVTSAGTMTFPMNGLASAPLAALTPGIGTTVAGVGIAGNTGDGGAATSARVGNPFVATDGVGNIYFADSSFQVVRRIDALTGVITKVAGTGVMGYSGDGGPALQATFGDVQAVTVDSSGNLYIADSVDCVVRKISAATGIITTVAGNGTLGYNGVGGPAVNAQLCPDSITVDAAGNLYLTTERNYAQTQGSWVLKVTASTGILSVVAGTGVGNYTGDGGPATAATLNGADGVALDSANNIYIADGANSVIRKVNAITGIITTIAGTGVVGYSGDGGPATSATMEIPRGIVVDSAGDVYFTDCCTYTVRKIDSATGIIRTVAGGSGSSTDGGPAVGQSYSYLDSVALDGAGNIYFGDFNARLHKVDVSRMTLTYPTSTPVGSLDSTDNPQTAILSDVGNQTLNSYSGNGAISASWSIDGSSTCAPLTSLAAGTSCTLPVDFKPAVPGSPLTGALTLLDTSLNAQPATQTITLTGAATGTGRLSISPPSLMFGPTVQGSFSATQTATITNTTSAAIYLSSGSLTDANDFTQSDNCSGLVAATTGSCTVTFTFTPQSTGPLSSTYAIHDLNNPGSPLTVALSGNATSPGVGVITLSPSAVNFTTTPGVMAASQNVMLTNTGTAQVNLGSSPISITGTNASVFQGSGGTCGYNLAAGSSCNAVVTFLSTSTGSYAAAFNVSYISTGTTTASVSVPLTGTVSGTAQASLTPPSVNFGNVTTGSTATAQNLTLTNAGSASLSITSISLTGATPASYKIASNNCVSPLAAGNSCSISVSFTPSAAVTQTASLTVVDGVGTQSSSLSGVGVANTSPADFTLTATPAAQSSYLGSTVSYQLVIAPLSSTNPYATAINLSATGLPAGATVSFAPASVTPGAATAASVMTVTVPALQGSNREAPLGGHSNTPTALSATVLLGLLLGGNKRLRRRPSLTRITLLLLLLLAGLSATIVGCGGGFAIPQSTSTITITGTSGALVHSATVTLTLK